MFGWADCVGVHCSNGELAWRFVRGPAGVAAGVAGGAFAGKLLGPVASKVGTALATAEAKTGPVAALALLFQLSPEATVGIANAMNVERAEQIVQAMELRGAQELMEETPSVVEEAATHGWQ